MKEKYPEMTNEEYREEMKNDIEKIEDNNKLRRLSIWIKMELIDT